MGNKIRIIEAQKDLSTEDWEKLLKLSKEILKIEGNYLISEGIVR